VKLTSGSQRTIANKPSSIQKILCAHASATRATITRLHLNLAPRASKPIRTRTREITRTHILAELSHATRRRSTRQWHHRRCRSTRCRRRDGYNRYQTGRARVLSWTHTPERVVKLVRHTGAVIEAQVVRAGIGALIASLTSPAETARALEVAASGNAGGSVQTLVAS